MKADSFHQTAVWQLTADSIQPSARGRMMSELKAFQRFYLAKDSCPWKIKCARQDAGKNWFEHQAS